MEVKTKVDIESRKQRITNVLLLNSSFIDNLGLMHGKMGIAIYFYHLARESQNKIYENYAGELIDEIYEQISLETPLDFENGLAGIGWGIEYLVQQGFIEADTNKILEDFDNRLQQSQDQFQGIGLLKGIIGLGAYYLKRIQNPHSTDEDVPTLINRRKLLQVIEKLEVWVTYNEATSWINSSGIFSITWDYVVLIGFLTEVYQLNLFNNKVAPLLQKVIDPLFQQINFPKLQSERLLLALAFKKLQECKINKSLDEFVEALNYKLLSVLDRNVISSELSPNSALLQNGTSSISWIYNELFILTGNIRLQQESTYWLDKSYEFKNEDNVFAGFNITNEKKENIFGLLEGLAGIALISVSNKISNSLPKRL
jgi:hypothetical protein